MPPAPVNMPDPTPTPAKQAAPVMARPDPYVTPVEYLKSKGWRPLGFENHPSTLWEDTSKPFEEVWSREPIMVMVERNDPDGRNGEKIMVEEQLHYHTGISPNGQREIKPRFRLVCTPASEPMTMSQAIQICLHIERLEAKKMRQQEAKETRKRQPMTV